MTHQNATPADAYQTDQEFARAIGIVLPDNENDKEAGNASNPEGGDPWTELHRASTQDDEHSGN